MHMFAGLLFHLVSGDLLAPQISAVPCDIGDIYQTAKVECILTLQNTGMLPVKVIGIRPGRADDQVTDQPVEVPAQGSAEIRTVLNTLGDVGAAQHYFDVDVGTVAAPQRVIIKPAFFVQSIVDDPHKVANFGVVEVGGKTSPTVLEVPLQSMEAPSLKVLEIVQKPDFVTAAPGDGTMLRLAIAPNAPWGLNEGLMTIRLNSPRQPLMRIRVRADVHGVVVPNANPVDLGLVRDAEPGKYLVRLDRRDNKPLRIKSVWFEGLTGRSAIQHCADGSKSCALVELFPTVAAMGHIEGSAIVEFADLPQSLRVYLSGMRLSPSTPVKQLDSAPLTTTAATPPSAAPIQAKAAASPANAPTPDAAPPGTGPVLKWTVEHDDAVYGYVIYRAAEENGAYERINRELIHTQPADDQARTYRWRDTTAVAGNTMWYSIAMVMRDGSRQALSGPHPVEFKPK